MRIIRDSPSHRGQPKLVFLVYLFLLILQPSLLVYACFMLANRCAQLAAPFHCRKLGGWFHFQDGLFQVD